MRWDDNYDSTFLLQHTHYPQYAGPGAAGRSLRGPFGDALLEFDSTVGNILAALEKTGVINNTLILFTADNGFASVCVWSYPYITCSISLFYLTFCFFLNGKLFLSFSLGQSWCACPVEGTLALCDVEKVPHMRGACESQPLPSGQGRLNLVSISQLSAHNVLTG